jgi:hypothetical protein
MKSIYNFIDKIEEFLYKNSYELYFVEFLIKLKNDGLVLGKLPLILKVKNGTDPEPIILEISDQLTETFTYKTYPNLNFRKIKDVNDLDEILKQMEIDFDKFSAIGEVVFNTVLAKPKMEIKNITPLTIDPNDIPLGFKILNKDIIEFGIIETKDKRRYINNEDEFQIFIKFNQEIKKVIDEQPKEVQINRINELFKYKPKQ